LRGRDLVLSRAHALAGDRSKMEAMQSLPEIELAWTLEEDATRREKTGQPPVEPSGWVRRVVVRQIPERPRFDEEGAEAGEGYEPVDAGGSEDGSRGRHGGAGGCRIGGAAGGAAEEGAAAAGAAAMAATGAEATEATAATAEARARSLPTTSNRTHRDPGAHEEIHRDRPEDHRPL
jgi:hypothetical protein